MRKEVLIVDGYNMIGAWPELVALKQQYSLEAARDSLLKQLANYHAFYRQKIIVVFDAQLVPGIQQNFEQYGLEVVFTKTDETADAYIERIVPVYQNRWQQVIVATSDLAEQWLVFQKGALRQSAFELYRLLKRTEKELSQQVKEYRTTHVKRVRALSDYQVLQLEKLKKSLHE